MDTPNATYSSKQWTSMNYPAKNCRELVVQVLAGKGGISGDECRIVHVLRDGADERSGSERCSDRGEVCAHRHLVLKHRLDRHTARLCRSIGSNLK